MGALGSPLFGSNRILLPGTPRKWVSRNLDQRRSPQNAFNQCLDGEEKLWRSIVALGGLQAICPGRKYVDPPWIKMPMQGKRLFEVSSIPMPANDGTDNIVKTFLVPLGYDGVIVSQVFNTTNPNFIEGSGELSFRIRQNLHYAPSYGNVQFQIGSLITPTNGVNMGQTILKSGQKVDLIVNNAVGSGLIGGRVIMSVSGWYWPR